MKRLALRRSVLRNASYLLVGGAAIGGSLVACSGGSNDAAGALGSKESTSSTPTLHPLGYQYVASEHNALPPTPAPPFTPPPTADVSQFAPPIGDQGQIGDCTTWAVGYGLSSWLANQAGLNGGKNAFAPMFIFTHFAPAGSTDFGISARDALAYLMTAGIDTVADYDAQMPMTFATAATASAVPGFGVDAAGNDVTDQPTPAVVQNALTYTLGAYQVVFDTPPQSNPGVCPGYAGGTLPIQTAIAGGSPVVIAFPVPPEFDNYDGVNAVQPPTATETSRGGHAILCTKYDSVGLWCQNSWGTSWGAAGMVQLSWAFVEQCIWETDTALTVGGQAAPSTLNVGINAPSDGQTVSGTVAIDLLATAGANAVSEVDVEVNGNDLGAATSEGLSFTYQLDTTQLENGPQTLGAIVTDSAGNTVQAPTLTINVSN